MDIFGGDAFEPDERANEHASLEALEEVDVGEYRERPGIDAEPSKLGQDVPTPLPVITPVPRTHMLSTMALLSAILCPIGPGAVVAILFGLVALFQIKRSEGRLEGVGRAKAAICLSCIELIGLISLRHSILQERTLLEAEASQFFHDFTRCQEDESFGEKARARMSQGLRNALKPPLDGYLSFEIADTLGSFHSFQSCSNVKMALPRGTMPKTVRLNCASTFEPNGPPIRTNVALVLEEDSWRVVGFSLSSPLVPKLFSAQGAIFPTVELSEFDSKRLASPAKQKKKKYGHAGR